MCKSLFVLTFVEFLFVTHDHSSQKVLP